MPRKFPSNSEIKDRIVKHLMDFNEPKLIIQPNQKVFKNQFCVVDPDTGAQYIVSVHKVARLREEKPTWLP